MRLPSARILIAVIGSICFLLLLCGAQSAGHSTKINVDYPLDGSVFPPEITPPTFLWRDSSGEATHWVVEVSLAGGSGSIRIEAPGAPMQTGEIDPTVGAGSELLQPTPEQRATRTWRPDEATWAAIKRRSVKSPATVTITGFAEGDAQSAVSSGGVTISTSADAVGAPLFYRDVPLMAAVAEKGSIQPLPTSALPLIKWRLRNIAEPRSRVVMENVYTCANCHSFSSDGKTMGLDVDGPQNDKGLYALISVARNMAIRNQDMIRWSSFQENAGSSEPAVKRFGFMSQVSPDGRYVITSIGTPGAGNAHQGEHATFAPGLSDRLFSTNYKDLRFSQVFYPTRGILAWYDRKEGKLHHLPGADDPRFVQTSAFWSPDGKYLIFSRAAAREPYPPGAAKPEYANDPREPQIQYDLCRIPFNEGRGGKAEPIPGASANGMSNNFPKVSPDGRWIVFVQCHNGLLMRPDSKLLIIPFAGGKPRLMKCNLSPMNSWHTFSPNGRWMAFSSKARSPYTRLMLTHIDADGNDTPAIMVDDATAANRAVNIPEFVNTPPESIERIDPQATAAYRLFNEAFDLMQKNELAAAIPEWREALQLNPDDARAHFFLALALTGTDQEREAVSEYHKACELDAHQPKWLAELAVAQANTGDVNGAVASFRKSLAIDPSNADAEANLGAVLLEKGETQAAYEHLHKAVTMAPDLAEGHSKLAAVLAKLGRLDEAIAQMQQAVMIAPGSVEYNFSLGVLLNGRGDSAGAVAALEKAVTLSESRDWRCLAALAEAYEKAGRAADAVQSVRKALAVVVQEHDGEAEARLRGMLERYEGGGETRGQ
jgi:Flp pilus assembly protein TadD